MRLLCITLGGLLATTACAQPLSTQLLHFFQQREPNYAATLSLDLLTATRSLPCSQPQIQLPSNSRRWGPLTLTARCGKQVTVLRVVVKVIGTYYQSRQRIEQGASITAQQIMPKIGRLDTLPRASWLTPPPLPLIALQTIPAGKILTKNQFRQPWVIKQGETVPITFSGRGFHITGRAIALDNAGINQTIRIRLATGQRLTARLNDQHELIVQ
ncbi:flagellar basal body P-ring formation chaperone FlgA [Rosenbergiella collisarenosi]|uniref:flagellar basal body P-ring formation chaperone FlgA n=1 Tax=Rosenbergiella collisarenosi TaxID=1544695 RepID=UPI001F4FDC32